MELIPDALVFEEALVHGDFVVEEVLEGVLRTGTEAVLVTNGLEVVEVFVGVFVVVEAFVGVFGAGAGVVAGVTTLETGDTVPPWLSITAL